MAGGQDCGAVKSNGEWYDDDCTDLKSFVCEKGTVNFRFKEVFGNSQKLP